MICPLTGDKLREEGDKIVSVKWGVKYPIRNGIPIMLVDEAQLSEGVDSIGQLEVRIKETTGKSPKVGDKSNFACE